MNKLTQRQIFFITLTIIIAGSNIVTLPALIAIPSNWPALALAAAATAIPLLAWLALGLHSPNLPMRDYAANIVGKPLAFLISTFYAAYFALALAAFTHAASAIIQAEYLPRTPIAAIAITLIAVFTYAGSKGLANQARMAEFWGLLVVITTLAVTAIMLLTGPSTNLTPIIEPLYVPDLLSTATLAIPPFLGIAIFNILPLTKEKRCISAPLLALLAATIILTLTTLSTFAILGISETQLHARPLFSAIREARTPYRQIINRMDFIFIASWLFAVLSVGTIVKHAIDVNIKKFRTTHLSALATLALALFLPINPRLLQILGIIAAIVIPILLLIIAKFRKLLSLIIALSLMITLTGCWDALDIQRRNIVLSMFADYNDGSHQLIVEIAAIRGTKSELEAQSTFLSASGENWHTATANLNRVSDYPLHLDSMYALVIGNGLAQNPTAFTRFLNQIRSNNDIRKSVYIFTTDIENVEDLTKIQAEHSLFVGSSIEKTTEHSLRLGRDVAVQAQDILHAISSGNPHFVMPIVSIANEQLQIGDYAIFRNARKISTIPADEKKGLLFLLAKRPTAIYEIDGFIIETTLRRRRITAHPNQLTVNLTFDSKILNPNPPPDLSRLQNRLTSQIARDIYLELHRARTLYITDYLGFWQHHQSTFPNTNMEVIINARIN